MRDNVPTILFNALLKNNALPEAETEIRFAPPRRWRFDYGWPRLKIALEVEGGIWTGGRHTRGAGFVKDIEKYNEASALGWIVLRTTPKSLLAPETLELLKRTIQLREAA